MIFISTGGEHNMSAYDYANVLINKGISNIELSGGLYESVNVENYITLSKKANIQIHNYFPPPEIPFVFNLASKNDEIAESSMNLAKNAIKIAKQINRPIYSFHAGFLIDPKTDELGKTIRAKNINNREECLEIFISRINILAQYAKSHGVELLIENNVISQDNYNTFGDDPLLMTIASEAKYIMENTPDNVNMLLDVAHLKVSSNSLGIDKKEMFTVCDKWIKAYHLSDNNGSADTNETIDENSWFWPYIKPNKLFYTLEVYGVTTKEYLSQIDIVERKLAKV